MSSKPELITIRDTLTIRKVLRDGRCIALCSWKDGEWKVEVFASKGHALKFADENKMEVVDVDVTR